MATHRLTRFRKSEIETLKWVPDRYLSTVLKMFSEVKLLLRKSLIWHQKFTLKQSARTARNTKGLKCDLLKNAAGRNMVQGYFYSKPLPYEDFSDLLNSSK